MISRNAIALLLVLAAHLPNAENPAGCLEQVQEGKDLSPTRSKQNPPSLMVHLLL
jgi:hypothetical protein